MDTSWPQLTEAVFACRACRLAETRTHVVLGEGNPHAPLMLIGEGPGEQEDKTGRPFVGPAGQLLDRMLQAIALQREQVYICNIVKCRPPHNRVPEADECAACMGYLRQQTALVRPQVILLLGATAARTVIGPEVRITRDRGVWVQRGGLWMLPTYHPSALLRDESKLSEARRDFAAVRAKLWKLSLYGDLTAYRKNAD